jgi:hypothetical protein
MFLRTLKTSALLCVFGLGLQAQAGLGGFYMLGNDGKLQPTEPDYARQFIDELQHIDSYGLTQGKVDIVISGFGSDEAASDYGHIVNLPRQLALEGEYGNMTYKYMNDLVSVFSHEYGHFIFGELTKAKVPEFARLNEIGNRISELTLQIIKNSDMPEAQVKALQEQIREQYDLIYKDPLMLRVAQTTIPYSELFADTVAVYAADSKSVIFSALWYPHMHGSQEDYIRARDFGVERDPATWTQDEAHVMFSPLRSKIGSDECWPKNDRERSLKLRQLAGLMIDDIKSKLAEQKLPVIADNVQLIENFGRLCH